MDQLIVVCPSSLASKLPFVANQAKIHPNRSSITQILESRRFTATNRLGQVLVGSHQIEHLSMTDAHYHLERLAGLYKFLTNKKCALTSLTLELEDDSTGEKEFQAFMGMVKKSSIREVLLYDFVRDLEENCRYDGFCWQEIFYDGVKDSKTLEWMELLDIRQRKDVEAGHGNKHNRMQMWDIIRGNHVQSYLENCEAIEGEEEDDGVESDEDSVRVRMNYEVSLMSICIFNRNWFWRTYGREAAEKEDRWPTIFQKANNLQRDNCTNKELELSRLNLVHWMIRVKYFTVDD
jgi:hypothetical protein